MPVLAPFELPSERALCASLSPVALKGAPLLVWNARALSATLACHFIPEATGRRSHLLDELAAWRLALTRIMRGLVRRRYTFQS